MAKTPSIIGICSYCVLDRPVFDQCQTLLHPELTPWWSFLLADGAHHILNKAPGNNIYYPNVNLIVHSQTTITDNHSQTTITALAIIGIILNSWV